MKPGFAVCLGAATLSLCFGCAATPPSERTSGAKSATKRVAAGCDRTAESRAYADFVEKQALVMLNWDGMSREAAELKIPVYVVAVENDELLVRFLRFPLREQYLHIWLGSGHIRATDAGDFLLDPCSATLEPVPE